MSQFTSHYYNAQLRRYLIQFMAIFANMEVEVGKSATQDERLITVPIYYGHMDRVVAHIISEHTQNKPLRLPTMSAYISGIELAPDLQKGIGNTRRNTYIPQGGIIPDDITVVRQYMPIPYRLTLSLGIYASNTRQLHQILEQIMIIFDPTLQIQSNDDVFDWTRLTTVMLIGFSDERNFPSAADPRVIQMSLEFNMPVYISAPADVRKEAIRKILLRVGTVAADTNLNDSFEVIADLDGQGLPYEEIFDIDDANLNFN